MYFNIAQIATLGAAFISGARAWDVELYTSDDCSGGPNTIDGGIATETGCLSFQALSVDLYSLVMDYDDEQHHNIILYQDYDCKCEVSHALTCPGAETLGVGKCTSDPFGNPIKSIFIELNGSSGSK